MTMKQFLYFLVVIFPLPLSVQGADVRGVGESEPPAWFKTSFLDLREDVNQAAGNGKRLFIYFHQSGCPYCAELINNNFSQKHIVNYTRKHFDVLALDLWGSQEVTDFDGKSYSEKIFAANHKVWFTPTLLFFDEQAKVALRINGYYPPHQFMTALRYVAEKHDRKIPFRDYYAKHAVIKSTGKLHSQPFYRNAPHDLTGLGQKKPLIVFFEQKDCQACDRLHQKIFPRTRTQEQIRKFDAVQLDMWSKEKVTTPAGDKTTARQWAGKLGITYAPSAVLFDEGKEVMRIEAFLKEFHVQSVMDYVASDGYKTEPSFQRYLQARADKMLEQGKAVDIWK